MVVAVPTARLGSGNTSFFSSTAFYAYLSATQTVTDNTETTITFNTDSF